MKKQPVLFLLFTFYFSLFTFSQDSINVRKLKFESIGIDQGLSQGFISSILQDKQGYLWFATRDGLDKYDGYGFTIYRHDVANPASLADNNICNLLLDSKGRLWISTASGGVDLYDAKKGNFIHFPQETNSAPSTRGNALRINNVQEMAEDETGAIWLFSFYYPNMIDIIKPADNTPGNSSYTIENGENRIKALCGLDIVEDRKVHTSDRIFIIPEAAGKFWLFIGTYEYYYVNGKFTLLAGLENIPPGSICAAIKDTVRNKFYFFTQYGDIYSYTLPGKAEQLWKNTIPGYLNEGLYFQRASMDESGKIWITSYDHFYCFDPKRNVLSRIENTSSQVDLDVPQSLCIDRSGIVWAGTNGYGLLKFNPSSETFNPYNGLIGVSNSLKGFLEDKTGNILVSRANVYSPYIFSKNEKKYTGNLLTDAAIKYLKANKKIFTGSTAQDSEGDYWLSFAETIGYYKANAASVHLFKNKYLQMSNEAFFIYAGKEIMAANDTVLFVLDKKTEQVKKLFRIPVSSIYRGYPTISALIEDKNNILWLGTVEGVFRLNESTGEWKHFANKPGDTTSLSMNTVFSLCTDPKQPDKYLWAGTNGGGLNRLEKATGICKSYTVKSGLPNDVIYGILSDSAGNLWLSTNKGLSCLNPYSGILKNYTVEDGLQSNEFNRYAYMKTKEGELFFGGVNGLNFFRPEDIQSKKHPPPIVFTGFKIFNKEVTANSADSILRHPLTDGDIITLPYNKNMLAFEYAALDFTSPALNHYKYRLTAVNQEWVQAETRREAAYNNLDPGIYTFEVEGRNSDGTWSEKPAKITIIITPPWWNTWWARTVYALSFLSAILLVFYLRTRNLQRKNLELEKKVTIRTEQLQESNAVKDKLFSIISHDLRGPLNSLNATLRLFKRGKLSAETSEKLSQNLEDSMQTTLILVDNLLSWSHSQMKGFKIKPVKLNLEEIIRDKINLYAGAAAQKKLTIITEITEEVNLNADENVVSLVLRNILNNAIKFSNPGGKITISTFGRNRFTGFSVKDEGIGISQSRLEALFKLGDEQKVRKGTASEQGSGLGLVLCRELVKNSGGEIKVESKEGKGTTITVYFPDRDLVTSG